MLKQLSKAAYVCNLSTKQKQGDFLSLQARNYAVCQPQSVKAIVFEIKQKNQG